MLLQDVRQEGLIWRGYELTSSSAIRFWMRSPIRESKKRTSRSSTKLRLDCAEIRDFSSRRRFCAYLGVNGGRGGPARRGHTSAQLIFHFNVLFRRHREQSSNAVTVRIPIREASRRRHGCRGLWRYGVVDVGHGGFVPGSCDTTVGRRAGWMLNTVENIEEKRHCEKTSLNTRRKRA